MTMIAPVAAVIDQVSGLDPNLPRKKQSEHSKNNGDND